jgi:hypothetical protein
MIDHPFINLKALTDEELIKKSTDLHKKLMMAHMWSSNPGIADQFRWMLEMIAEEQQERLAKDTNDAWNKMFPEVIESDPEFTKERSSVDQQDKTHVVKPAQAKPKAPIIAPTFHKEYLNKKNDPNSES